MTAHRLCAIIYRTVILTSAIIIKKLTLNAIYTISVHITIRKNIVDLGYSCSTLK